MPGAENLRQVLTACGVERDAEQMHARVARFLDRHAGIFLQIALVAAVVVIGRATVGEDQ